MIPRSLARILGRVRPGRSNGPATNANEYRFITHWRVPGNVAEVADVLSDAPDLPRWWPAVYLDVQERESGDEDGIGKEVSFHTTGWLPYELRWQFRVTESNYPHGFALEAWGDFVGNGEWTLRQDGDQVAVTYDWRVRAEKPLLRWFSFVARPVFEANHRWAMARGEESLRLELARRAATEEARHRLPPPPGPTSLLTLLTSPTPQKFIATVVDVVHRRSDEDSTAD